MRRDAQAAGPDESTFGGAFPVPDGLRLTWSAGKEARQPEAERRNEGDQQQRNEKWNQERNGTANYLLDRSTRHGTQNVKHETHRWCQQSQNQIEEAVTVVRLDESNIANYTTPARAPTAACSSVRC